MSYTFKHGDHELSGDMAREFATNPTLCNHYLVIASFHLNYGPHVAHGMLCNALGIAQLGHSVAK